MKRFKTIPLPFEENKTYKTNTSLSENFKITRIVYHSQDKTKMIWVEGIYEHLPHLGVCPLNLDRLVPETEIVENPEFMEAWRKELKRYHKEREHLSEDEMTNSDFCDYVMNNFEFPKRIK